jgi:hypothetical protein
MIDPRDVAVLQEQIRRTGRSLLQYTLESFPWTRSGPDRETLARIHAMARAEQVQEKAIRRYLVKHRAAPPYLGAYPMHFTTMNFLAIPRLVELLQEHQQQDLNDLEMAAAKVRDPEGKALLIRLLEIKTENMNALKQLHGAAVKG